MQIGLRPGVGVCADCNGPGVSVCNGPGVGVCADCNGPGVGVADKL